MVYKSISEHIEKIFNVVLSDVIVFRDPQELLLRLSSLSMINKQRTQLALKRTRRSASPSQIMNSMSG